MEFAQIFCSDKMPDNKTCDKYFQIPQSEVIKGFFKHKRVGHVLAYENKDATQNLEVVEPQLPSLVN